MLSMWHSSIPSPDPSLASFTLGPFVIHTYALCILAGIIAATTVALILLAIGSVAAGYIGVPHALGGGNQLAAWLAPAFAAPAVSAQEADAATGHAFAAEPTAAAEQAGGSTFSTAT